MSELEKMIQVEGDVIVIRLPAEFTGNVAYDMEEGLLERAQGKAPLLLFDMSQVSQITSAAISLLIKTAKLAEENAGMAALAALTPVVDDVFAITKMKDMLHVFDSEEKALQALRSHTTSAGKGSTPDDAPEAPPPGATAVETVLFDKPGPKHTQSVLQIARKRADALGIRHVVVATTTGKSAVEAAEAFAGADVGIVGVTLMAGVWEKYDPPDPELMRKAEAAGVRVLTATHTLMGNVGSAIREKFGGVPEVELIAHTYYTFSQGMKVAVEVATMAADANLIPAGEDVIAVAGTGSGADTAIVLRPAYSNCFFDTKIREILAMPR